MKKNYLLIAVTLLSLTGQAQIDTVSYSTSIGEVISCSYTEGHIEMTTTLAIEDATGLVLKAAQVVNFDSCTLRVYLVTPEPGRPVMWGYTPLQSYSTLCLDRVPTIDEQGRSLASIGTVREVSVVNQKTKKR